MKILTKVVIAFIMMLLFQELIAREKSNITINGYKVPCEHDSNHWKINYKVNLGKENPPELELFKSGIKKHPKHPHIAGYNGDVLVKIVAPGLVEEIGVSALYVNYADRRSRTVNITYSLNGFDFLPLANETGAGGGVALSGTVKPSVKSQIVWLRFRRELEKNDANGRSGYVVFRSLGFALKGSMPSLDEAQERIVLIIPDKPISILRAYSSDYLNRTITPELNQTLAAERLQMLIARATGVTPLIVKASEAPKTGMRIFVGYGPHLEGVVTAPEELEGLKIQEQDGNLFILGQIAPAGMNNWPAPVDLGVMHAVETFAEKVMGYRFLNSTPDDEENFVLGTVIPQLDGLSVEPGLLIEDAPVFRTRLLSTRPRPLMGLRANSSQNFACNHSYAPKAWEEEYGKKHPEMFIPKKSAEETKAEEQAAAMGMEPDFGFLDYTEPKVLEERLKHLDGWFKEGRYQNFFAGRTPNDTYIIEERPDRSPGHFQYNDRARQLFDPSLGKWGNFSGIWFDYLNRLSAEAKTRWSAHRISALAYTWATMPPDFDIADNIDVQLALIFPTTQAKDPVFWNRNLDWVKRWSEKLGGDRNRLLLWEYGCWPDWFVASPANDPFMWQKWIQKIRPYVSGVFFEFYGPAEMNFITRYLWMKLLWNPDIDVAAELADVCKAFYGPAGEDMTKFNLYLIERYAMAWKDARPIWDQYYVSPHNYYGESYTAAEINHLAGLLEAARAKTGLPPEINTNVVMGSAVFVYNAAKKAAPVEITISATGGNLPNPSVGWDGGRLDWKGSVQPGERLAVNRDGRATLYATNGTATAVNVEVEGSWPEIEPEQSEVFHFWHRREGEADIPFQVQVRYGKGTFAKSRQSSENIYARRVEWTGDAYLVFSPTRNSASDGWRGMFADAHTAHRYLRRVPEYRVSRGDVLPKGLHDGIWKSVATTELVTGKRKSAVPYEIMGYPANLRTRIQMLASDKGLAVRFVANGKPVEKETVTLEMNGKSWTFPLTGKPYKGPETWTVETGKDGWAALVVLPWESLGFSQGTPVGREVPAQILRSRAPGAKGYNSVPQSAVMENYIWSPPLGMWGDGEQGSGKLVFAP